MFKEGTSIEDIAAQRFLSATTIFSHLSQFILSGEVDILDLVDAKKLDLITSAIEESPGETSTFYKIKLGEAVDYSEIRAGMLYLEKLKKGETVS